MTNILVIDVGTTGLRAAVVDATLTVRTLRVPHRARRRPRRPGWSSSTPRRWPRRCSTRPARRSPPIGEPIDGGRHHQPARQRHGVGPRDRRAGRPRARLAGPAHRRRLHHGQDRARMGARSEPVGDQGGMAPGEHPRPRRARPLHRHGRLVGRLDLVAGRAPRHRPHERRRRRTGSDWSTVPAGTRPCCDAFGIPVSMLATVVDSIGVFGEATALPGSPPIAALLGDQQASLVGQGCVRPGRAKITFGTGGMLDVCTDQPTARRRPSPAAGTFPSPPGRSTAASPGASRASCCRPAPTSSGSATTSA